jgi:hypothetical protein
VRWNYEIILNEIRRLHFAGEELNFTSAQENHFCLLRAAVWHFGSWKNAVELAGFSYQLVSKYRNWTRESLVEAIREHHRAGHDLSWRAVSTSVDPALAAAALRPQSGFATWGEALAAAGVNQADVARYRRWTPDLIVSEISELARLGSDLSSKVAQEQHRALFCAATRHFGSWNNALAASGVDPSQIGRHRLGAKSVSRIKNPTRPLHHPQLAA